VANLGSTILTDVALAEAILGDIEAFVGGKAVATTQTIGTNTYTASVQLLTSGPVAPFQNLSNGSVLSIFSLLIEDYAQISSGAPISVAFKVGATWYGISLSYAAAKT
jgi:hypothetical protein